MSVKRMLAGILAVCLVLTGCSEDGGGDDHEKLSVVTTLFPQYDFVREIAGDNVNVSILLPAGAESHSFEPTPKDIISIKNCDVFIYVGGESDSWIERMIDSIDTADIAIIALMDLVETVEEEIVEGMEHENEDNHGEPDLDEHVWTSPENAMKIVQGIAAALCGLDEKNAPVYEENARQYIEALTELDYSFREVIGNGLRNTVIFADRFPFRYFADAYGLDYYGAFPGCSPETEASAATIAFLIDKVREEEIPVVFYIEFSNERMADTICESTGARKLLLHSCHNISLDDFNAGMGYITLMEQNLESLREALY